jgi:hypothetical protein
MSTDRRRKQRCDPDREQVTTKSCSAESIVRSRYFTIGVADLRAGTPPRFDEMKDDYWAYERGRLWAVLAPVTMDPYSPIAVQLFKAATKRGWII